VENGCAVDESDHLTKIQELCNQLGQKSQGMEALQNQVDQKSQGMEALQNQVDQKSQGMEELQNQLDQKSQGMEELQNQLDQKSQGMEELQKELHRRSSEFAKLLKTVTEFNAKFDGVYVELMGCIEQVVEQLVTEQEKHREAEQNLMKERDDVKEQLECMKDDLRKQQNIDAALKAANEKLQKVQRKLKKQQDKNKELKEECDDLKVTVRELGKTERPNIVALGEELKKTQDEQETMKAEHNRPKLPLESVEADLRGKVEEMLHKNEDVMESTVTLSPLVTDAALASGYAPEVRSPHQTVFI